MVLALIIMLSGWGIAALIKIYMIKESGKLLSGLVALGLAVPMSILHVYFLATWNEEAGIQTDGTGYVRAMFLTMAIIYIAAYVTMKKPVEK
ncbi:hypothetical protein SAMN02927930_01455 [Pseudidiomarina indica]|uniref:Uncharacterized protein n=1 Tax=Pseudidiomarina indica TaxID=1159017 RepID=A0A1G6CYD2_9GAMM|nr:hypothetical protein [Pseudidiomarina indica]SDB37838.1 hypothetical protein SAMN02927930_01455 [Pseudidiomarina indica]